MHHNWENLFKKLTPTKSSLHMTLTFYDREMYKELRVLALKRRTNVSSMLSNMAEAIVKDSMSPTVTMDPFMHGAPPPQIWDEKEKWLKYMKLLSVEEFKEFDKQLNMLLNLLDKAKLDGKY